MRNLSVILTAFLLWVAAGQTFAKAVAEGNVAKPAVKDTPAGSVAGDDEPECEE